MTQQQQDILNEAIDVCQNEMQANNPNIPRMTFACGFALASMLSVLKMDGEGDYDKVGLSWREIGKIKQEPVDPRNYAEDVTE